MNREKVSQGWEAGLAPAWIDWPSTGGSKPPFQAWRLSGLSFLRVSMPLWQILKAN
jgi:hypothetical protein